MAPTSTDIGSKYADTRKPKLTQQRWGRAVSTELIDSYFSGTWVFPPSQPGSNEPFWEGGILLA